MNYLQILAAYVASFDAEKKQTFEHASKDGMAVLYAAAAVESVSIQHLAFMATQESGDVKKYLKDVVRNSPHFHNPSETLVSIFNDYMDDAQDNRFMTYEEFAQELKGLDPLDIFSAGLRSEPFNWYGDYFRHEDGNYYKGYTVRQAGADICQNSDFIDWYINSVMENDSAREAVEFASELSRVLIKAGY